MNSNYATDRVADAYTSTDYGSNKIRIVPCVGNDSCPSRWLHTDAGSRRDAYERHLQMKSRRSLVDSSLANNAGVHIENNLVINPYSPPGDHVPRKLLHGMPPLYRFDNKDGYNKMHSESEPTIGLWRGDDPYDDLSQFPEYYGSSESHGETNGLNKVGNPREGRTGEGSMSSDNTELRRHVKDITSNSLVYNTGIGFVHSVSAFPIAPPHAVAAARPAAVRKNYMTMIVSPLKFYRHVTEKLHELCMDNYPNISIRIDCHFCIYEIEPACAVLRCPNLVPFAKPLENYSGEQLWKEVEFRVVWWLSEIPEKHVNNATISVPIGNCKKWLRRVGKVQQEREKNKILGRPSAYQYKFPIVSDIYGNGIRCDPTADLLCPI